MLQVDGNTEDRGVQEKFIGVLMETMRGGNFPTGQPPPEEEEEAADDRRPDDGTVLQDLEDPVESAEANASKSVAGPALPRQNGYVPNADRSNDKRRRENLRYDVRNMYAQIGSYPDGPES